MDLTDFSPLESDLPPVRGGRLVATFTYPDPATKSALEPDIGDVQETIGDVKTEIGAVTHEITDVRNEIGQVRSELDSIRSEIVGINDKLTTVPSEVAEVRANTEDVRGSVEQIHHGFAELRTEFDGIHAEFDSLRNALGTPREDVADIRSSLNGFNTELWQLRDQIGSMAGQLGTLRDEMRDVAVDLQVQKRTAVTAAWAAGATVLLAMVALLLIGWNLRQNIDRQLRTALNAQEQQADSIAQIMSAAKASADGQVAASRELYRLTLRELDRFGAVDPRLQTRLIATLPPNVQLMDADAAEIGLYVGERDHDVIALVSPQTGQRWPTRQPLEAVIRLNTVAEAVTALLMTVRRTGSDALSCHRFFRAVDGLNKLQCPGVEAGRYEVQVTAFLNDDATRNPRPGYTLATTLTVQEAVSARPPQGLQ